MKRSTVALGAAVTGFVSLGLVGGYWASRQGEEAVLPVPAVPEAPLASESGVATPGAHRDVIYGRVTGVDGSTWEGRLRFGADEEAFWGEYFNATRDGNPWAGHVPAEEREATRIFGFPVGSSDAGDLRRPFMVRFGDMAKIEARGRDLRVTLKSGAVVELDRYGADDFADGVRVWDVKGVVDLDEDRIRSIALLPAPPGVEAPRRLYGTVRTRGPAGDFTGFLQWNREKGAILDVLRGRTAGDEPLDLPFGTLRSIERRAGEGVVATLLDGQEIALTGTVEVGPGNRGIYVNDPRYGRVLVPWDTFERVDFGPGPTGSGYDDFPAGGPLTGTVVTRSGRRLSGRLVYDLDESETIETLDAPAGGVDYTIPFGRVATIELQRDEDDGKAGDAVRVTLHSGEALRLERSGDLSDDAAGMLVFEAGRERPAYVPWSDVARVELDAPSATPRPTDPR